MQEINSQTENWDDIPAESSYWDYYDEYYYDSDYDWNERDNPCHSSYYGNRRSISKNVLASDLGIIAKKGNNGKMLIAVNDLKTTQPLHNVKVDVYNYQQQKLSQGITGQDGLALIEPGQKPFLLIASHQKQKGYLRLDDGSSLSVSNFNVGGQQIQEGIKGFIYGERGVWRPGDSLFITFILEDQEELLPDNHPVIFELLNPKGQLEKKIIHHQPVNGFYSFATKTDDDAITGNWTGKIKVGGATFSKTLKIETIKPNRLKINLDFGKDKLTALDNNINGKLDVKWLHGATAGNLKAAFEVVLTDSKTRFEGYEIYNFDDPARDFYTESQDIFEGNLDDQGHATINANIDVEETAPGMLTAHFKGKVFEESGNFSIDRFSIPYYPYQSFVGIKLPEGDKARGMLLTDTTHLARIATVDANGNPISRSQIEVEMYKLDWRWWWDQSENNISNYISNSYHKPIKRDKISTSNGKGTWEFKINYPEWGRFFIRACDPVSGHCTGQEVYIDWPGWAGRGKRDIPGGATMLSFSSDKEQYQVGEDITIHIPGNADGRAMVSLENGSGIINQYWVETNQGETPFTIPVTEEMAPNIYIHVTLIQPHSQTSNDLPIRMYGILPVSIDNPDTHLNPQIKMPDELKPGQKVDMYISESSGKAMTYTIAVVDEGLLDLTRFSTPDPGSAFYAKEALGVKTWDLYDDVMGAFGGELGRILAIGGDQEIIAPENSKANRFKPVVVYMGPFFLNKGNTAKHSFVMPQYVGSVKTMVVAGNKGAYGSNEKATPVRQDIMVMGTLPRVLGPDETVKLPVNLFVMNPRIKNATVSISTNEFLSVEGNREKKINIANGNDQITFFDLKVQPELGVGKVTITASTGKIKALHDIEIQVRNPNPPITQVLEGTITEGKTWETSYAPVGMEGTNTGIIEVSSIPPINFGKRLKFLLNYPHGCLEQRISKVFPQIVLGDVMELSAEEKAKTETNIKAMLENIKSFLADDGGLAYWPGDRDGNEWITSYAGHFLLEAAKKGYRIPEVIFSSWKRFQKTEANNWRPNSRYNRDDLVQAYRLYTLALAKMPELGAMNRMREIKDLSIQARWRLAAAYALAGQKEVALDLINNLSFTIKEYQELTHTYGSTLRDKAMILETLVLLGEKTKAFPLAKEISQVLSDDERWLSTQTTAFALLASAKFSTDRNQNHKLDFTYQIDNGKSIKATTELPLVQKKINVPERGTGKITIKNNGQGIIYARLLIEGTPIESNVASSESNLRMNVIYKSRDGELVDPDSLVQGTDFFAEVTVANPGLRGDYEELALTQIFPSGWEIYNTRLDETGSLYQQDKPEYQDIRDDRVYTYFDLKANQRKTFRILLNSSYAGEFYLPVINCEAMYDNGIHAYQSGKKVKVVKKQHAMIP